MAYYAASTGDGGSTPSLSGVRSQISSCAGLRALAIFGASVRQRSAKGEQPPFASDDRESSRPLFGADEEREGYIPWAELLKRVYQVDVLACPCGGKRRFVGHVTEPTMIREGLEKLGLWSEAPKVARARRPPQEELFDRRSDADGVDPPPPELAA
jgi:hypothetical protein